MLNKHLKQFTRRKKEAMTATGLLTQNIRNRIRELGGCMNFFAHMTELKQPSSFDMINSFLFQVTKYMENTPTNTGGFPSQGAAM